MHTLNSSQSQTLHGLGVHTGPSAARAGVRHPRCPQRLQRPRRQQLSCYWGGPETPAEALRRLHLEVALALALDRAQHSLSVSRAAILLRAFLIPVGGSYLHPHVHSALFVFCNRAVGVAAVPGRALHLNVTISSVPVPHLTSSLFI